jgi:LmbE family N-acetylglucosaminyl deacetylase
MKRVLVIVPHPDDAEFHAGGLLFQLIQEGAKIHIITATDGRCGTYSHNVEEIKDIRKMEAEKAAQMMGASIDLLDYPDYGLDTINKDILREQLVRLIRTIKPDLVIAEDPCQKDQVHPDHRYLAECASDAIHFSQLPNVYPEHVQKGLTPHFVTEKYFYTEDPSRINKVIDVTLFIGQKLEAMRIHQSQVQFLVEDVMLQAKAAGLDLQAVSAEGLDDPFQALSFAMMAQMANIGKITGVPFGEGYRYVRFHPYIENLLQSRQ